MKKQQQLSPEKYILNKARSLPIYKCYLTRKWAETKMANIMVIRLHVNGNYTVGFYLIDLLCLGVKDTFYMFNCSPEALEEKLDADNMFLMEADYNLVHNIIYAGHDFAMDFDIPPHKDFRITKYILEEDDESVPLIEIPVGDEHGNPCLMVSPTYNYGTALQKLKQNAGEGNYTFFIGNDGDPAEDDDEFDDDEFGNDDDDDNDDGEIAFMDFHIAATMETGELEELIDDETYNLIDRLIVNSELMLRSLDETESGAIQDLETVKQWKDYQLFDRKIEQWQKSSDENETRLEALFPELQFLMMNQNEWSNEDLMQAFMELIEKDITDDTVSYYIVSSIPLLTVLSHREVLEENFSRFTPLVQLFVTAFAAIHQEEIKAEYHFITNASNVEMAYPFNRLIHAMHHRLFWLIKAIVAIKHNDKEKVLYYHNLLRTTGTGGHLKSLYAAQLINSLRKYLGLEDDEEFLEEDEYDESEDQVD